MQTTGRYLAGARANEADHYDALAALIGADAPKGLTFRYPAGAFASRENASNTGIALGTAFIGAYVGAIRALDDPSLKVTAGQISPTEFGHYIVFTDILTGLPVGRRCPVRSCRPTRPARRSCRSSPDADGAFACGSSGALRRARRPRRRRLRGCRRA